MPSAHRSPLHRTLLCGMGKQWMARLSLTLCIAHQFMIQFTGISRKPFHIWVRLKCPDHASAHAVVFWNLNHITKKYTFLGMSHKTKGKQDGKKFLVNDNSEPPWHVPSTDSETELRIQLHNMNLSHLFAYFFRPEDPPQVVLLVSQRPTPLWWPGN